VVQRPPTAYVFDPDERARVVAMLPAEVPLDLLPNEGDPHRKAKRGALDALDGKGLDFVLEVHVAGDRRNVAARLLA
jgi:hypothetical protein